MENKKVSIIIPVYKVEKYLEECIESLLEQSYHNLEIILIDDESPDECPRICDIYAKKYNRIKVIHKENGGAASARNKGLEIATGAYISFVDSDDCVQQSYIKKLVSILEKNKADISVCSFSNMYKNREESVQMEKPGVYSNQEYLERFLWDWKCGLIWNKLFRAEILENVRFQEGHVIDDEFFTYKAVINAKKICVENQVLYKYRKRLSGVMNQGRDMQIIEDRLEYLTERFEVVRGKFPELQEKYFEDFVDNLIRLKRETGRYNRIYRNVKATQRKYLLKLLFSKLGIKIKYAYIKSMLSKCQWDLGKYIKKDENYFE